MSESSQLGRPQTLKQLTDMPCKGAEGKRAVSLTTKKTDDEGQGDI